MNKLNVALLPNSTKDGAVECARHIADYLSSCGFTVYVHRCDAQILSGVEIVNSHFELAEKADVFIAVGGDGTIIHAAKHAVKKDIPVLGVNMGTLGYLAGLESHQISQIPEVITGLKNIEKRMMMEVVIKDREFKALALNDAVISGELSKILDYNVSINNSEEYSYRADGLIIATPTGSTAYSLSAGGPVVDPQIDCMIFTPICPHSLFSRSSIYGRNNIITVKVFPRNAGKVYLTVDGEVPIALNYGDEISFKCSETYVKLIRFGEKSFFDVVSKKLIKK